MFSSDYRHTSLNETPTYFLQNSINDRQQTFDTNQTIGICLPDAFLTPLQ